MIWASNGENRIFLSIWEVFISNFFPHLGSPQKIDLIFTKMAAIALFMLCAQLHFLHVCARVRAFKL